MNTKILIKVENLNIITMVIKIRAEKFHVTTEAERRGSAITTVRRDDGDEYVDDGNDKNSR